MASSINSQQQSLALFQPNVATASRNADAAGPSTRVNLDSIKPATVSNVKVADSALTFDMRKTNVLNRLNKVLTTTYKEKGLVAALKAAGSAVWKGVAVGAFVGVCTGGIKGAFLGAFLGGLADGLLGVYKGVKKEAKVELLNLASQQMSKSDGDLQFNDSTLRMTRGKSSINLSNLDNKLGKNAEAKIATVVLNAKNDTQQTLAKLDLKNNPAIKEDFAAKLIAYSTLDKSGQSNSDYKHGLEDVTVNLKKTGVKDGVDLLNQLNKELGTTATLDRIIVNESKTSQTYKVSYEDNAGKNITVNLKVDADFTPPPERVAVPREQAAAAPQPQAAAPAPQEKPLSPEAQAAAAR